MAFARLGPTASRTSSAVTPVGGGFTPSIYPQRSAGTLPRFGSTIPRLQPSAIVGPPLTGLPQSLSQEQLFSTLVKHLEYPINPAVMQELVRRYRRPKTFLGLIFKVFDYSTSLGAGWMKGATESISEAMKFNGSGWKGTGKDILEILPPWASFIAASHTAKTMAEGFGSLTNEEWLKESNNPDSFLYRHAKPIGLTLDFVTDPLMYVSFGAGGGVKAAATARWSAKWMSHADEALKLSRTPAYAGKSYDSILMEVARSHGTGLFPSDELRLMGAADAAEGGLRGALSARGGKVGMRFMGGEIPGTHRLGAAIAKEVRPRAARAMSFVIPGAKEMEMMDDVRRTVWITEQARYLREAAQVSTPAQKMAMRMFADNPKLANALINTPARVQRAELSVANWFSGHRPAFVPQNIRRNLLKEDWVPKGPYGNRLKMMRTQAVASRNAQLGQARAVGFEDDAVNAMKDHWDELVARFDDPVDVVSRFTTHVQGKIANRELITQMLKNPLFARIDVRSARAAMDNAFEEMTRVSKNAVKAQKMLKIAKTPQARASATSALRHWDELTKVAKGDWTAAKTAYQAEAKAAGGRMLRPGEPSPLGIPWETGKPMRWLGVDYVVPEPIYGAIDRMRNPAFIDEELSKGMEWLNWTQNKWKILATSPNPQFHTMNLLGGIWNNMLAGVYNPFDHVATWAEQMRLRSIQGGMEGFRPGNIIQSGVIGKAIPGIPHTPLAPLKRGFSPLQNAEQAAERLARYHAANVPGGFMTTELGYGKKALMGAAQAKSGPRRAFTTGRRAYGLAAAASIVAPDEWIPDEVQTGLLGGAGALALMPEALKIGGAFASEVEMINRMTPYRKYATNPRIRQQIEASSISPPTEFGRWIGQTDLGDVDMAQEIMYDIGANVALRFQFDYGKLTEFERTWAKTFFPFYTFYKNNFVLQFAELAKRPRFLKGFESAAEAVSNYAQSIGPDDPANNPYFKELLPEYFDKLTMFQVPVPVAFREKLGLPRDQPLYMNPKLPFASLNMVPPVWELMNDGSVTPTMQKWQQVFSPVFGSWGTFSGMPFPGFKLAIESVTGVQLGLARPIDFQQLQSGGWRFSKTDAPGWARVLPKPLQNMFGVYKDPDTGRLLVTSWKRYVMDQMASPFVSGLGEPIALSGGQATEKTASNTVSWMTGIRLTPVDPVRIERGWLYRMENFLEGRRLELRDRGLKSDPEDDAFLERIRAQIKVIEAAWDAKQKDLYGNR